MAKLHIENENVKKYIFNVSEKLMRHFDLEYEITKEDEYFDLYAFHRNDFFKSFITKSTVYEGYSVFEHMLLRFIKDLKKEDIESFQDMLIRLTPILSNPNKFHKRSVITGIIVTESPLDKEWEKMTRKFFYKVNYKLLFHGWSETQYAIVSMTDKNVYLPKMRKKELKLLLSDF